MVDIEQIQNREALLIFICIIFYGCLYYYLFEEPEENNDE